MNQVPSSRAPRGPLEFFLVGAQLWEWQVNCYVIFAVKATNTLEAILELFEQVEFGLEALSPK